jgi:hypothetical protein
MAEQLRANWHSWLRCFAGAHRWQARQDEDGRPYKMCRNCGTVRNPFWDIAARLPYGP